MKRFLPIVAIALGAAVWLGWLMFHGGRAALDLGPYATGEMSKFEVFKSPRTLPGSRFLDRDGKSLSLKDFKGKVTLVNLWATWCEPCKQEMPALAKLSKAMAGRNFQIVTISLDWQGFKVIDPFLMKYGLEHLETYWDKGNRLPADLDAAGLPITILVGANGKWLGRADGALKWDSPEAVRMMEVASR